MTPEFIRQILQDELQNPDDQAYFDFHDLRFADTLNIIHSLRPEIVVPDVGIGQGFLAILLRRLFGCMVQGVDISRPEMERWTLCYSRNGISFTYCDITCERLPFEDSTFDLVLLCEVIEHVPELDVVMAELRRALKRGGRLIVSTPNVRRLAARILSFMGKDSLVLSPAHIREFSMEELKARIRAHGHEVEDARFRDWWSMKHREFAKAFRILYRLFVMLIPHFRGGILISARKTH